MPTRDLATLGRTALLILGLLAAVWIFSAQGLLAQPLPPRPESQQLPDWVVERDRLGNAARRFRSEGDFVKAIAAGRDKLAIERRELPSFNPAILEALIWLADVAEVAEDWTTAEAFRLEAIAWTTKHLGAEHWQTTDARLALANQKKSASLSLIERRDLARAFALSVEVVRLYGEGRYAAAIDKAKASRDILEQVRGENHPEYAQSLINLARLYESMGDDSRAQPLLVQIRDIRKRVFGENHPEYAASLNYLAELYRRIGDRARAEPLYVQSREIRKRALGENHPDYATSLNNLGLLYESMGDHARAEPLLMQACDVWKRVLGENHPDYATSLNNLGQLYESMGDYARAEPLYVQSREIRKRALGENHPSYALSLNNLAMLYRSMGDYARAEPLLVQTRDTYKRVLGENHPDFATSLNNLAVLYQSIGDYTRAEPLYVQARDIRKRVLGENHPSYVTSLNNLAMLYQSMGDDARAEPLLLQARDTYKRVIGENHPDYAGSLNNLAVLYRSMGDYARAEPLLVYARDIRKRAFGENHPDYAESLNNLAMLYQSMGDDARAEPLLLQARDVWKRALGENHPRHATSLNNLAAMYEIMGDYARAEPLYVQAREIRKRALGVNHPDYATSLNNLAMLYRNMGDDARAEPLQVQAIDIRKQALGENHPDYAEGLNNLAMLYRNMGDDARAEPLLLQAREIKKRVLGENHPSYALSLNNLAMLYHKMGDDARAEPLSRQAIGITRKSLQLTSAVQSERQQLAMGSSLRYQLDNYVSLGLNSEKYAPGIFGEVLRWKGATLVRQRGMRLAADDPGVTELFGKLQETARHLVALSRTVPEKENLQSDWRNRIAALTQEKERLEGELSKRSAAYRAATKEVTLEDLLATLPKDTVLVDYLEFTRSTPSQGKDRPAHYERQLVAFVVRAAEKPEDRVRMFALGAAAPIGQAIDAWRETFGVAPAGIVAGSQLRKAIWEPLLPALSDAMTILVSTDGVLGRLPLVALPGKAPDTYLLEDHRLALIPVPQLLPALVNHAGKRELAKELLLIGDVDYDAAGPADPKTPPKKKSPRQPGEVKRAPGADAIFSELEYTKTEIDGLRELYGELFDVAAGDPYPLTRGFATEAAFRQLAPTYRHLHLATHGFFASPEHVAAGNAKTTDASRSHTGLVGRDAELVGYNPGLLSGLALAGANLEPRDDADDGILTSQEIAFLPLGGVDLVVLSACETGLGDVAGGEGLLGVQRAFQVAGARTTVAGLWKVNDLQTMALMKRFYQNLWKKEMSRLDALRESQLWLLKEGPRRDTRIKGADEKAEQEPKRSPPYYWAPFVLSGDWR